MNRQLVATFILGFLVSTMLGISFFAGQQQTSSDTSLLLNQQILLDSKIHLIEMKIDVVTEQKNTPELLNEYGHIVSVLKNSHQYTGEGVIARDAAMRAAAQMVNEALLADGRNLLEAIEALLTTIEHHLHPQTSAAGKE